MTKRMRIISLRIPEDIYQYYSTFDNSSDAMRYALISYAAGRSRTIASSYEQYELPLDEGEITFDNLQDNNMVDGYGTDT